MKLLLPLTLVVLVTCTTLSAQRTSGVIGGRVADQREGLIARASVVLVQSETQLRRESRTDDQGRYRFSGLPSGTYEVRATVSGFKTGVKTGLILTVAQELVADFVLEVGGVTDEVTVVAEETPVSTQGAAIDEIVSERQVRDLPLNGRDLTQLIFLQKGVVESRGSTRDVNVGFGKKVSVAGARPDQNLFITVHY